MFIIYYSVTQVVTLEEFFGEEDVFFVYGNERLSADDFELEFEGKFIGCYYSVIWFCELLTTLTLALGWVHNASPVYE